MKLWKYCVLVVFIAQYIQCNSLDKRDNSATPFWEKWVQWAQRLRIIIGAYTHVEGALNEKLPIAQSIEVFNRSSDVYKDAIFYAKLSMSANCRASFDRWDCENCTAILPDGVVVRGFSTYPLSTAGTVVRSEKKKSIYVVIRTDSNFRAKVLNSQTQLVNHPHIKNAKVQQGYLLSLYDVRDIVHRAVRDQIQLYPNFTVRVVGHSFGAGVGSLLVTDLHQRLPSRNSTNLVGYLLGKPRVGNIAYAKYIADNNISINRFVEMADSAVHQPPLTDGYVHEGTEYWLNETNKLVHCPGQYETQNCSSSLTFTNYKDHLTYFGVSQECEDNKFNIF